MGSLSVHSFIHVPCAQLSRMHHCFHCPAWSTKCDMTTKGCSKYTWWVEWHGTIFSCYFTTTSAPSCKICKKVWIFENLTNMLRISFKLAHCSHFLFPSERGGDGAKFSNFCGPPTRRCHTHTTRQPVVHLPTTDCSPEIGQPILPLYGHSLVNHHRVNSVLIQFSHFPNMPRTFS